MKYLSPHSEANEVNIDTFSLMYFADHLSIKNFTDFILFFILLSCLCIINILYSVWWFFCRVLFIIFFVYYVFLKINRISLDYVRKNQTKDTVSYYIKKERKNKTRKSRRYAEIHVFQDHFFKKWIALRHALGEYVYKISGLYCIWMCDIWIHTCRNMQAIIGCL